MKGHRGNAIKISAQMIHWATVAAGVSWWNHLALFWKPKSLGV